MADPDPPARQSSTKNCVPLISIPNNQSKHHEDFVVVVVSAYGSDSCGGLSPSCICPITIDSIVVLHTANGQHPNDGWRLDSFEIVIVVIVVAKPNDNVGRNIRGDGRIE